MLIKKIEIKNFRSILKYDSEELSQFNIFAGKNDSGKSNVLKALNLFFNNETAFLDKFNFKNDYSKLALLKARDKKKARQFISIKIYFNYENINGRKGLIDLAIKHKELWVERTWWDFEDNYFEKKPSYLDKTSEGIKRSFSFFIKSIKYVYIPAFKNSEVFSYMLKLAGEEENIIINDNSRQNLNDQISQATSDLSRDFFQLTGINANISLPVTLESFWSNLQVSTSFNLIAKQVLKRGKVADYLINFIQRGEGIKSVFMPIILGWLVKNIRTKSWIWGIDEPENSLEEYRANELFLKLMEYSSDAQLFVSTHSPAFIFPSKINTTVYLVSQQQEGDTNFLLIKSKEKETSELDENIKDEIQTNFGVDYKRFMEIQMNNAKQIQSLEQQKNLMVEEFKNKIKLIQKPIIFTEGNNRKYLLTARDLLAPDIDCEFMDGKGKDDLKALFLQLASNRFNRSKILFVFDSDAKTEYDSCKKLETNFLLPFIFSYNEANQKVKRGIENLFNQSLFEKKFYDKQTQSGNYGEEKIIETFNKNNFCEYICEKKKDDKDFINFKPFFDFLKKNLEVR